MKQLMLGFLFLGSFNAVAVADIATSPNYPSDYWSLSDGTLNRAVECRSRRPSPYTEADVRLTLKPSEDRSFEWSWKAKEKEVNSVKYRGLTSIRYNSYFKTLTVQFVASNGTTVLASGGVRIKEDKTKVSLDESVFAKVEYQEKTPNGFIDFEYDTVLCAMVNF